MLRLLRASRCRDAGFAGLMNDQSPINRCFGIRLITSVGLRTRRQLDNQD